METKLKVGVIPAAGSAKRFGYLSGVLPKALLPLYDRPIIHHVVDQMQNMGIEEIYIIVNAQKEKIIDYFKRMQPELRSNIYFVEQKILNGTGESILISEKYVNKRPFIVIYGDDCTLSNSLSKMTDQFVNSKAIVMQAMIKETDLEVLRNTCSAKLDKDGKIIDIVEKPENPPYLLRGCGIFMFRQEIFDSIRQTPIEPIRNEREIIYTISNLAKVNKANGYLINGSNININNYDELVKATLLLQENKIKSKKEVKVLF